MNVAIATRPSGKSSSGAEVHVLVALVDERRRDHEAERRNGDEAADDGAEAEGRRGQERAAPVAVVLLAAPGADGWTGAAGASAATGGSGRPRTSPLTSRIQSAPKETARTAPSRTMYQPTTRPSRRIATPTANPTGQRLGGGTCGLFSEP